MATGYLEHTVGTPDTNGNKKLTFSAWIKRSNVDTEQAFYVTRTNSSNFVRFRFLDTNYINITSNTSGTNYYATTNRLFRDTSAWYHIVVAYDTTQASSSDRIKMYVNGTQQTFSNAVYPAQDATLYMLASGQPQRIGQESGNAYFDGYMSHVHYTEGHAYAASTFGETDSTSGIWKPKTAPSVTYGTNGFFLKFENGAAMGTDSSGQSNTFTVNNSVTQNVDSPTNNVCVWNRNFLTRHHNESTSIPGMLQNGNTTFNSTANAFYGYKTGTLAFTSGKWYWENKITDNERPTIGICYPNVLQQINTPFWDSTIYSAVALVNNTGAFYGRNTGSTEDDYASGISFANNDIVGLALDMDNKALYVHKNGTYINSGNPASGASRTGSIIEELTGTRDSYLGSGDFVSPLIGDASGTGTFLCQTNFGSGFFGTTAVASANADANGHGAFEYAVPSGYYTLNTKNLKEFG